jgi:hypothetical protein
MKDDLHRIGEWAAPFKNPKAEGGIIVANLMKNYADIVHRLDNMNGNIAKGQYRSVGRKIANILIDILGPLPTT